MDVQTLVARNLRKLRVLKGLSQEALAVDARVDRTYVSRVERNLENPTVGVLDKLAKALEVEISDFFVKPKPGEAKPTTLKGGRKRQ